MTVSLTCLVSLHIFSISLSVPTFFLGLHQKSYTFDVYVKHFSTQESWVLYTPYEFYLSVS